MDYSTSTPEKSENVLYCVKSVRIRSYSGPHFPAFGLNNSEYGHFLRSVSLYFYFLICFPWRIRYIHNYFDSVRNQASNRKYLLELIKRSSFIKYVS